MDTWQSICERLSVIFTANKQLNFGIELTPEDVAKYLLTKTLFVRFNSTTPADIEAALFVTNDGECGFIANKITPSAYRFLHNEFINFVVSLPVELQNKLWCRIQHNNKKMVSLVSRIGFEVSQVTENAIYFTHKGGN